MVAEGNRERARNEIRTWLADVNRENATLLSPNPSSARLIRRSFSGRHIAWLEGKKFFYWYEKEFVKLEFKFLPLGFQLSPLGRYAALLFRKGRDCRTILINLKKKKRAPGSYASDCNQEGAPGQDGKRVYTIVRGELITYRPGKKPGPPLALQGIKARYKKIQNTYRLRSLEGGALLLFFGQAGYYEVFALEPEDRRLRKLGKGFARPEIFPRGVLPAHFQRTDAPAPKQAAQADGPGPIGYLLEGAVGKYSLRPLIRESGLKIGRGGKIPYSPSLTAVSRHEFLTVQKGVLSLWNSRTRRSREYPLLLRRFFLFSQGIVYEDVFRRLHLRRTAFTGDEKRLLALLQKTRALARRPGKRRRR